MEPKHPEVFDVDHIVRLKSELQRYNKMNLREATFLKGGVPVEIPVELIDEFEFTGLNNADLVDFLDFVGK